MPPLTHEDALETLAWLESKRSSLPDAVHRNALDAVRGRFLAEITGDIGPALAACDPDFTLTLHGADGVTFTATTPDAVRAVLEDVTGDAHPIVLWMDFDHLIIEGRTFALDGVTRTLCFGARARRDGLAPQDDDGIYLISQRLAGICEFGDDGRLRHEVVYTSAERSLEALTQADQLSPTQVRETARLALGHAGPGA